MPRVTVIIITLDEAEHIAAAIDSVSWADEVLVVDAGSADSTVAIARARGARTEIRGWTGYVDQKNFATSIARNDWIFSLDADERVPPALASEIRALLATDPPLGGYRAPRVTYHLGRWVRTTDFYPDYQLRLYDRRRARWQGRYVHESVAVDGPIGRLSSEIEHYSYRDLRDHLDRINRYTSLAARQMHENGWRGSALHLLAQPPAAFLRNYVLRRGFLDGTAGLTLSLINSYAVFLKFAKLWELQRTPNSRLASPGPTSQPASPGPDSEPASPGPDSQPVPPTPDSPRATPRASSQG